MSVRVARRARMLKANDERSHAGPLTLGKPEGDLPALADLPGSPFRRPEGAASYQPRSSLCCQMAFHKIIHLIVHLACPGFTAKTQEPCLSWLAMWNSGL